jgi:hypothetical protein
MSPFQFVVVDEALHEGGAEIGIEARIILVGIDDGPASDRRLGRQ